MPNPLVYFALALSAVLVVFPLPSSAQPPQNPDVEALLRWKQSLPNQTIISSWILNQTNGNSSASSPCNWRGISCNSAGNVTGLNLAYTGLQGTLDHLNFSYFPLLLRLDLKYNRLNGIIPANIGLLSNLVYLDLSTNSFSGTIPLLIANLTKVVELDFSRNNITGQLDPRLFPDRGSSQAKTGPLSIQRLLFTNTLLGGPLPSEIGLCGLPLSKKCGDSEAQEQPISQVDDDDDDDDDDFTSGFTWRIVLMGYGCGFLIGVIMGFAMFFIGRPRWYMRIVREPPRRKVVRVSQIGWRRSH